MRFTMICIGSMGDVKPYVLLGSQLQKRGHDVGICAFNEFEALITENGMRFLPLSGDVRAFMSSVMKPGTKGVTYLKQVRDILRDILEFFLRDLQAACEDADVVVATFFGQIIQSIAEKKDIPFIKTHYYPMDPNDITPISSAPGLRAGKVWYRASYSLAYLLISTLELYYLTNWRKTQGMRPRRLETTPCNDMNGHRVPVLYAMSPLLMPRPVKWDEHIHMTGFWLDDTTSDYQPSPELEAFLAVEPKPVYIGFGSMTSGDMGQTLAIVQEAIKRSGVRAVIATGWGAADPAASENTFVVKGYVPHDWLFTHVSAVVHHGGAGTTAAGLCAGCPTLVIPFGGDQPFWAMRVRMLGLGPTPITREQLTVSKLTRALQKLTSIKSYRIAAAELGDRLRMEHGVEKAADIIEAEVRRWLTEEPQMPPHRLRLYQPPPIPSWRKANGMRGMRHPRSKRR